MSEDLEEIKERQEQLEQYVSLLEARVDVQESLMNLYTAGREPAALPGADGALTADQNAGRAPTGAEDPNLKGFDFLLRSILTQQGMHNTDIRKSARDQKRLQSSIDRVIGTLRSIEETLRHVDANVSNDSARQYRASEG